MKDLGIHDVLLWFGIRPGVITTPSSNKRTYRRLINNVKKMSEQGKKRRKRLRGIRKGCIDNEKEQEAGDSYASGAF